MANFHEIVFAFSDKAISKKIQQQVKAGQLRKIAPRIYTSNLVDEPKKIVFTELVYYSFSFIPWCYPQSSECH